MRPIIIYSNNKLITQFLELLCQFKRIEYALAHDTVIELPLSYNGPAIVDDDVTIYYFSQIIQYLDRRIPVPIAIPLEPKGAAQSVILTMELLSNPQNHKETITASNEFRDPFVMQYPSIIDIALATLTKDSLYESKILEYK